MSQVTPVQQDAATRPPLKLGELVVGVCILAALALGALWLLSQLPFIGAAFGAVLDGVLAILSLATAAVLFGIKAVFTLVVAFGVLRLIKDRRVSVPLVAVFVVWLWTDWLNDSAAKPPSLSETSSEQDATKKFNDRLDEVRAWEAIFKNHLRR